MPDRKEVQGGRLLDALKERAKELNCLYRIEEMLAESEAPLEKIFAGVALAIPEGWQFPRICRARITYGTQVFMSSEFTESTWWHQSEILVQGASVGRIKVFYLEEMPSADQGPFLKEEVQLLQTIATRLAHRILHQRLRRMFEEREGSEPRSSLREWRVALDMLSKIDQKLLDRIARKMMNHLVLRGVDQAKALLQRYGEVLDTASTCRETNQPQERAPEVVLEGLCQETFQVATAHLGDVEILEQIQKWVLADKSKFLTRAVSDVQASLSGISDALERYTHLAPEGIGLTPAADKGVRVALIRRLLGEQLDFIAVAKNYLRVEDFLPLLDQVIHISSSHGRLGGKTAGLLLANRILETALPSHPEIGVVRIPQAWYLPSDAQALFLRHNNIEDVYEQKYKPINEVRQDYPHLVQIFKSSHFPQEILKGLSLALDDLGDVPLVVRSSSLLEDRLGHPFSGKYKSLFLANQGSRKKRLEALSDAIAEIYASVFGPDPIEYRAERGLLDLNEEMGILIQEVVGRQVGPYFLPAFAGVAFSNNEMRWSSRIRREDGLLRLVPGLGTRAVDRLTDDYPVLIAIGQPKLRVNASVDELIRYSPRYADALNLETNRFETLDIHTLLRDHADDYPALKRIVSLHRDGLLSRPIGLGIDPQVDDPVVTFEGLIDSTPFVAQVGAILQALQDALGQPVDIEFASDGETLYLLQCRPQSSTSEAAPALIPKNIPDHKILFTALRYVSNGRVPDLSHIVYVDPERYSEIECLEDLQRIGVTIGLLNSLLPKRRFLLMGPGRWGSRGDIKLGVRVTYSDISNTALLVEVARQKGSYLPDVSFGTHFFQDLVDSSIRYLPLYPDDPKVIFNEEFMKGARNLLPEILPQHADLADVVRVIDVSTEAGDQILRVLMNAEENSALAYLSEPTTPVDFIQEGQGASILPEAGDHWRWRLAMAEQIAADLDPTRFGVKALYLFGSVKNATAGPQSDIDILVHFQGDQEQQQDLELWMDGWSRCLAKLCYLRTGYQCDGLLDVHLITDRDIAERSSYAIKIGAVTDAARQLPLRKPG